MEIESEKKDKDINKTQNEREIERLNRKLKRVMEEYAKCAKERDELRAAINVAKRKKGRPGLSTEKKAKICTLYQQGNSMRQTAQKAGVSLGTVSNVIDEAKKSSRIVYVYMDRKKPATLLDIYPAINRLEIWNFTDDLISRAFGSREKPSWQEYEQFLEDRCMPRTRYGIKKELEHMGLDSYDPFQIVEITKGRVYGDGQWLARMDQKGIDQIDCILKKTSKKTKEEQAKALKKYTVVFNTEPSWIGTVIHGVAASMEEQAANGADIDAEDINAVRTGLMGPMAGIGDTVSQGIAYPILAGIACSLALAGNIAGPIIFEIAYKILMLGMGYAMYMMGYKQGKSAILKILSAGTLNKITEIFSIVGLMVVGNMAATRVTIKTPIAFKIGQVAINFQNILDSLLPGMLPLLATLLVWKLLNKKVKATYIIVILFVVGIIASLTGILAVAS